MSGLNLRLGLIMLLLCRCTFDPQTIAPDGGALRDASVDAAGCDDFKCAGILAFGNKTDANVATQCAEYLTDLQPSPVCGGCACQSVKSDCLVTASTWSDAACTTGLVDRKTTGNTGNVSMSTYDRINGYVKVDGVATSCTVDPAVKGGPTYAAKKNYLCNYFGTCSDLSCAAATEAQCVLVAEGYACPAAFPNATPAFTSVDDKRSCVCDCAGAVDSCAATPGQPLALLATFGGDINLTTKCVAHMNVGAGPPLNVNLRGLGKLVPNCVSAGKPVTGDITIKGAKTLCCR